LGLTCKDYLKDKTCKGHNSVEHRSYFFAIFLKSMGKMHSFDRGNPCAANFRVLLQSDVITLAHWQSFDDSPWNWPIRIKHFRSVCI